MRISKYSQLWYQSKIKSVTILRGSMYLEHPPPPPGTWKNVENYNLIEKTDFNYLIYVTYHSYSMYPHFCFDTCI